MATYDSLKKEIDSVANVHPDLLSEAKEKAEHMDAENEDGIINKKTGSSIIIKDNGDISIAPSLTTGQKYTAGGHAIEHSMESHTITVRKRIEAEEIVINDHKLNPALYEFSDMRQMYGYPDIAIGNLTLNTTVLVKAYEPTLKKWVLIRRPARIPMFSPILNLPQVPDQMDINTDIKDEILKTSQGGKKE